MSDPLRIEHLSQALVNAGVADGFRQGLEQSATNLRKQAGQWRAEAQQQVKAAGLSPVAAMRARILQAEVERWASRLDQLAAQIMTEHTRRGSEANQLKRAAEVLLGALASGQGWKRWLPWHK